MAGEGSRETGGWMRSSKKAITASLCSGLVVLIVVAIVFAGFRRGTQTAQPGGSVELSATAISASDQPRMAQNQPDQRTSGVGALLKRIADAPEPSRFSVEKTADEIGNNPRRCSSMFMIMCARKSTVACCVALAARLSAAPAIPGIRPCCLLPCFAIKGKNRDSRACASRPK